MKNVVKITESDLIRIVKRVVNEQSTKKIMVSIDCEKFTINKLKLTPNQITEFCNGLGGGGSPGTGGGGGKVSISPLVGGI